MEALANRNGGGAPKRGRTWFPRPTSSCVPISIPRMNHNTCCVRHFMTLQLEFVCGTTKLRLRCLAVGLDGFALPRGFGEAVAHAR